MRNLLLRALAGALGLYLALSLLRFSTALLGEETRRERLLREAAALRQEIAGMEALRDMTDGELRVWAFREMGLTGPGDTVFLDLPRGDTWDAWP